MIALSLFHETVKKHEKYPTSSYSSELGLVVGRSLDKTTPADSASQHNVDSQQLQHNACEESTREPTPVTPSPPTPSAATPSPAATAEGGRLLDKMTPAGSASASQQHNDSQQSTREPTPTTPSPPTAATPTPAATAEGGLLLGAWERPKTKSFAKDDVVRLHSLAAKPELNGRTATVQCVARVNSDLALQRYEVLLVDDGGARPPMVISVAGKNLEDKKLREIFDSCVKELDGVVETIDNMKEPIDEVQLRADCTAFCDKHPLVADVYRPLAEVARECDSRWSTRGDEITPGVLWKWSDIEIGEKDPKLLSPRHLKEWQSKSADENLCSKSAKKEERHREDPQQHAPSSKYAKKEECRREDVRRSRREDPR